MQASPSSRNVNLERLRSANARAQQLIGSAKGLQERFNTLQKQYNFTFAGRKVIQQFTGGEVQSAPENETKDAIDTLKETLRTFEGMLNETDTNTNAARSETPDNDPLAAELDALRADIAKLRTDANTWRSDEAAALGVGVENTEAPTTFQEARVDDLQRLINALLNVVDGGSSTSNNRSSDTLGLLVDTLTNARKPNTPMRTEPASIGTPSVPAAPSSPPPPPTLSTARTPRTPVRSERAPVQMPENEPWPTNQAEFRRQFTYSPDRFPSREAFASYLANRLNTPDRINQFLENMFTYSQERDRGHRQRIVNGGRDKHESDERWIPPLEFLTTYNSDGKLYGDCDDIALAFTYISQLQGKQAFAIETSTSTRGASGALEGRGHALSASFEPDGSVRIIDTTGIAGRSNASIQVTQRRPGETDEQLLKRAYQEATDSNRQFDSRSLYTVISMPNGDGFNLPGNLAFCRRHGEIQPLLAAGQYREVLNIVDQEIARDGTNLDLRLCKIQMLILAGASRSEVTAVINSLAGPPRVEGHTAFNQYAVNVTRRVLLEQSPQYIDESNALIRHCNNAATA